MTDQICGDDEPALERRSNPVAGAEALRDLVVVDEELGDHVHVLGALARLDVRLDVARLADRLHAESVKRIGNI